MRAVRALSLFYAALAVLAVGVAFAVRGAGPWVHPAPWIAIAEPVRSLASATMGAALAVSIAASTRFAVRRYAWAAHLHADLRPFARGLGAPSIAALSILSSAGEELLFRGLVQPWIGVIAQALLFGALHQVRGRSRWVWAGWAAAAGLGFGAIFALTGSLAGPLLAHAAINAHALAYLKYHDPAPRSPRLGGLLSAS